MKNVAFLTSKAMAADPKRVVDKGRKKASSGTIKGLIAAKIACCGALVIALTVGFGAAAAWLVDSGAIWLAALLAIVFAARILWRAGSGGHRGGLISYLGGRARR